MKEPIVMESGQANAGIMQGGCPTLNASHEQPIMLESNQNHATISQSGISTTLPAAMGDGGGYTPMITEPTYMSDRKGHNGITQDGTATTLTAQEKERPLIGASVVRRLTPLETERLQGFPDNWSKYGINEKGEVYELSDSARYRLQGNSIARPFWTWLMRRIGANFEHQPTLGSLFDGQAGFPLCAVEAGIEPVWASEIEKHAVAVVKYHFGDEDAGITGDWKDYIFPNTKGGSETE